MATTTSNTGQVPKLTVRFAKDRRKRVSVPHGTSYEELLKSVSKKFKMAQKRTRLMVSTPPKTSVESDDKATGPAESMELTQEHWERLNSVDEDDDLAQSVADVELTAEEIPGSIPASKKAANPPQKTSRPSFGGVKKPHRKPVLYLWSPSAMAQDLHVSLTLSPEWDFTVLYPIVPVKRDPKAGQSLQWYVRTKPDGTLVETETGLDVSYLYWETITRPLDTPPSSPTSDAGMPTLTTFSPPLIDVSESDVVLLSTDKAPSYLNAVLVSLGFPVEPRTSFITFWLPYFAEHSYIALRFIPQDHYNSAATLRITPSPDVVLRVFMVFKGIPSIEVQKGKWDLAATRTQEGPEHWKDVIGVDDRYSLQDKRLLRALEWGGMEV